MAKRKKTNVARKLLDAWVPPPSAGDPLGCVATTFTFESRFFEEQCVSRFLRLETDPRESSAAYLIEREEKLASSRVFVLVDRSNAEGSASARWDVLPVNPPVGIFHPKISVLGWRNWIRLIIGSANLTELAYRKNQEIFGILDFYDGGIVPLDVLTLSVEFLEQVLTFCPGASDEPGPKSRILPFLRHLSEMTQDWEIKPLGSWESPEIVPVFVAPIEGYNESVLKRLDRLVRSHGGPAYSARVLSPFFDQTDGPDSEQVYPVTNELLEALTDRGSRSVEYMVAYEQLPDGRLHLKAPSSLIRNGRKTAEYSVYPVDEEIENEVRALHAKSVWLWNDRWHLYMIGSSNFTSAGLGVNGRTPNFEANLAYIFRDDSKMVKMMKETFPPYQDSIDDFTTVQWQPADMAKGEDMVTGAVLPVSFEEALFEPGDNEGTLKLKFGQHLPPSWTINAPAHPGLVYSSNLWFAAEKPSTVQVAWVQKSVPNYVKVHWTDISGEDQSADWPVNVTDPSHLAPPEDLRNLSLNTLLEILCSGRPIYEVVPEMKNSNGEFSSSGTEDLPEELDPLKRFSNETFLLQRTRRVAKALEQLMANLSRPIVHRDVLVWRLRGPVGPLALAHALCKESRSEGEVAFLLTELVLVLRRINVTNIASSVDVEEARAEFNQIIEEIRTLIMERLNSGKILASMSNYITSAMQDTEI